MTNQQPIPQRIPYVAGGKILRYACSALCAAAFDKGITVGAFRYSGVGFVSAHTDAVQTAVVFADHVVLFFFLISIMIAPVLKEVTAAGSGERYTFSMPEAGGVMQERFVKSLNAPHHRAKQETLRHL